MNDCKDCERKRAECSWKGSILDYCSTMTYHNIIQLEYGDTTLQEIYPLHSSFMKCEKHARRRN